MKYMYDTGNQVYPNRISGAWSNEYLSRTADPGVWGWRCMVNLGIPHNGVSTILDHYLYQIVSDFNMVGTVRKLRFSAFQRCALFSNPTSDWIAL